MTKNTLSLYGMPKRVQLQFQPMLLNDENKEPGLVLNSFVKMKSLLDNWLNKKAHCRQDFMEMMNIIFRAQSKLILSQRWVPSDPV
jgi:hypothetical protein